MSDKPSPEAMKAANAYSDSWGPFSERQTKDLAHVIHAFAEAARKDEQRIVCDWIQNNLGERSMTDLLLDIKRRGAK